jgi:hypothetical protein
MSAPKAIRTKKPAKGNRRFVFTAPIDVGVVVKDQACPRCGDRHYCGKSFARCACGKEIVAASANAVIGAVKVTPEDGWAHTRFLCSPPPDPTRRCSCGFVILRNDLKGYYHNRWSSAVYSSGQPIGYKLAHTLTWCGDID